MEYYWKVWSQSSNNNTINNVKSYSHRMNGIMLWVSASHNTIMNTQTWNNQQNGIEIYLGGQYNVINNSLSYNNHWYGIRFGNISKYNTINNGQFFNNWIGGIFADFTTEQNIINNVHTYNNAEYGINFKRSSGNNLNNVYTNNKIWINMTDISCVNNKFNWDLDVVEIHHETWWGQVVLTIFCHLNDEMGHWFVTMNTTVVVTAWAVLGLQILDI